MDKRAYWLLKAAIILIPLSVLLPFIPIFRFLALTDYWYVQYVSLFSCIFMGISCYLWRFSKPLSLLTATFLFSAVVVTKQSPLAMFICMQVYLGVLAIYAISRLSKVQRAGIIKALFIIAIIYGALVVVQSLNKDPFFILIDDNGNPVIGKDDTVGLSGSKNMSGVFFAIFSVFIGSLSGWVLVLLPVMLFGLMLAKSSFAMVGFIAGSILTCVAQKRWKLLALIAVITTVIFCFKFEDRFPNYDIRGRVEPVKVGFEAVRKGHIDILKDKPLSVSTNPIFGYGAGNTIKILPYYQDKTKAFNSEHAKYVHFHNDFIEFIFEFGYIGLALLLWLLIDFIIKVKVMFGNKEAMSYAACVLTYLICACGLFASHTAIGAMWLIIFYGMFLSTYREWVQNGATSKFCER